MNAPKESVIITGITGQDGAYLTQLLLEKGYKVYGTYRRTSSVTFWRLEELGVTNHPNLHLVEHDLTDLSASIRLLQKAEPTQVYNLAAQSFVGVSFDQPLTTAEITGLGAVNLLEAIRIVNPKFYRPAEVELLIGNPEKAKRVLGWQASTNLEQLCQLMVETDLKRNKNGTSF